MIETTALLIAVTAIATGTCLVTLKLLYGALRRQRQHEQEARREQARLMKQIEQNLDGIVRGMVVLGEAFEDYRASADRDGESSGGPENL